MKRKRKQSEEEESPRPNKKIKMNHSNIPTLKDIIAKTEYSKKHQHDELSYVSLKSRKEMRKAERERKRQEKLHRIQIMRMDRERQFRDHQMKQQLIKEETNLTDVELQDIKNSFLQKKSLNTRKYIKPSEKFKYSHSFEWDMDDDTSKEINPVFQNKKQSKILFGKGKRGGIDVNHQISKGLMNNQQNRETVRTNSRRKRYNMLYSLPSKNWREKTVEEMTSRDWRIFREEFEIVAKGSNIPNPIRYWKEANLSPFLLEVVEGLYDDPTPIQKQCLPIGIHKRDMVGIAETGSGKTAAFSIPLIQKIIGKPRLNSYMMTKGPRALILVPTRELAEQIEQEILKLTNITNPNFPNSQIPRVRSLVGGIAASEQLEVFFEGCEILVATPGRLKSVLDERKLVLGQCEFLVLDEADKMVTSDFQNDLIEILDNVPEQEDRVMFMFSATMPNEIEKLASTYLKKNKIFISIGEVGRVVDRIDQKIIFIKLVHNKPRHDGRGGRRGGNQKSNMKKNKGVVPYFMDNQYTENVRKQMEYSELKRKKIVKLLGEITKDRGSQILVFVNMRKDVENLKRFLSSKGFSVTYYHGTKGQSQRTAALDGFRQGKFQVLVCTDLAGRGINILTITHVINFDMTHNIESYKHRIGRTGRAGRSGKSISLITDDDEVIFYDLRRLLLKCHQEVPKELNEHEASRIKPSIVMKKKMEFGGNEEMETM